MCFIWPTTFSSSSSSSPSSLSLSFSQRFSDGPASTATRSSPKSDCPSMKMLKCYKDVMRMFLLVVGHFQLVSYPSIQIIGIRTGLPLSSGWEKLFQLLVYFLVEDYTNYCIHRFLHSKLGYEKIHRVHHKYTAPFRFAAPYAPGHMVTFWSWSRLRPLKTRTMTSPGGAEYHDYQHYVGGQSHSNFASVFTCCDYIYGTDMGYRYQKKILTKKCPFGIVLTGDNSTKPLIFKLTSPC